MAVPFNEIIATFSPERQKELKSEVNSRIKAYKSLMEFRKELGLTQDDVAGKLQISQESVSRLESRKDMHISTLKRYVEALGGKLEIFVDLTPKTGLGDAPTKLEFS